MTYTNRFLQILCAALLLTAFAACDDDSLNDDDGNAPMTASLQVRLTDEPGDYEAVIVEVVDVQIKLQGEEWIDLNDSNLPASYDLLELTNGTDTLLAGGDFMADTLREVRLILGENNFVQIDSTLIELRTPSAQQSGLKVLIEDGALEPGNSYALVIDFDAGSSVVRAGNSGNYNLRPVLRATLVEVDAPNTDLGGIAGTVAPINAQHFVMAYVAGLDTFGTYTDNEGNFLLDLLPTADYTVEIQAPQDSTYSDSLIAPVMVLPGEIVNLGIIDLQD